MSLHHLPGPPVGPPRVAAPPAPPLRLAVVDMSGTSVMEHGLQDTAFARALEAHGLPRDSPRHAAAVRCFRERRASSRTAVFSHVFPDREAAAAATRTFEASFDALLAEHGVQPVPGAEEALAHLRALGLRVCLCTGYARHTQNMILESLGWTGLADLSLSPDDAGRGVPYPDMVLTALLGLDLDDVRGVLVVGDTAEDMTAGRRAGAGLVAGVRTGRDGEAALLAAGADRVVDGLADVPVLVAPGR